MQDFNPRAPCGARRAVRNDLKTHLHISTHAPLAGRDQYKQISQARTENISTHAPLAGRDQQQRARLRGSPHFNPRAPCGARRYTIPKSLDGVAISTHAPIIREFRQRHFNPRAPCGARPGWPDDRYDHINFNPRAPCGARPKPAKVRHLAMDISTHAPLAGRDRMFLSQTFHKKLFQPTRPLRGATFITGRPSDRLKFQPTRPLRGATPFPSSHKPRTRENFNPRAPCGARLPQMR